MAVEHMVWIKFKADVPQERIDSYMDQLRALPGKVPGIIRLSCGENFTDRAGDFKYGLHVTLESRKALLVYADHPDHVAVAQPMRGDADAIMAMDFEHD